MKTLYHGSYTEVSAPLAKVGRRNLDFGQGFYLTSIRRQAENWAAIIASRKAVNHQLCILNQSVIDKYLHFVECITLQSEEDVR